MLKNLAKLAGESSILGIILAGAAVVALAPAVKGILRGVAVGTAQGLMALTEGGSKLANEVKQGWEGVVAEAKAQKGMAGNLPPNAAIAAGAGGALGATVGGMAGPVGAAVGGGLGGVVGASVGSSTTPEYKDRSNDHSHQE